MNRCPYAAKYNGDGCEDTGGHDFYSCEIKNEEDLKKYDRYSSLDNQCVDCEDNYENCPYYKSKNEEE